VWVISASSVLTVSATYLRAQCHLPCDVHAVRSQGAVQHKYKEVVQYLQSQEAGAEPLDPDTIVFSLEAVR
jgi:hypothetical protein